MLVSSLYLLACRLLALVVLPAFFLPSKWVGRRLQKITLESFQLNAAMNATMTERFNVSGALLVFIGAGSVPAILLLEGGTKAPFSGADLGFISFAFGLVVVAMVYTVGKVSGCHINPARQLGPLFVQTIDGSHTHNWLKAFGAYIPANLIGAALAAFAYDLIATPRKIVRPIKEAVTEPDRAETYEPATTG